MMPVRQLARLNFGTPRVTGAVWRGAVASRSPFVARRADGEGRAIREREARVTDKKSEREGEGSRERAKKGGVDEIATATSAGLREERNGARN